MLLCFGMDAYTVIVALIGGLFSGVINTLAGSGSVITLTILIEVIGLPVAVANGTNRIGIIGQTMAGYYGFGSQGRLGLKHGKWHIIYTVIGAIAGIWVSVIISPDAFRAVFKYLMILMLFVVLIKPSRWLRESNRDYKMSQWLLAPLMLGLGFYGGFIQMGMGVFFLIVMVLIGKFSLLDANVIKLVAIFIYTFLAIVTYQYFGLISWPIGLVMAFGQGFSAYFTARYAANDPRGAVWAHRLLVVAILLSVAKLFFF